MTNFTRRACSKICLACGVAALTPVFYGNTVSGAMMNDPSVVPVRGQLVLLKPQPHLEYLYVGNGYIFHSSDAVVVGGTSERDVADSLSLPATCEQILVRAKAPFLGESERFAPVPDWMAEF